MLDLNDSSAQVPGVKLFYGNYRGKVVDNYDNKIKGRVKIYVPGVYPKEMSKSPDNLPWAEPALSLFGGNWTNQRNGDLNNETGISTIPHTSTGKTPLKGAEVWLFFENGNWMKPIYFASCQGGDGWHSEHNNQHVIKTDNVTIRVDENPTHKDSTCKFDTYNKNCTFISKDKAKQQQPTRVDVEIWNKKGIAMNLRIKGDVNIGVDGDVFKEINGNLHETINGNIYRQHNGDLHVIQNGTTVSETNGNMIKKTNGNKTIIHDGKHSQTILGDVEKYITGSENIMMQGLSNLVAMGGKISNIIGQSFESVTGAKMNSTTGEEINFQNNKSLIFDEDIVIASNKGNIYLQALTEGKSVIMKATNIEEKAGLLHKTSTGGTIQHNKEMVIVEEPEYVI
jgi:hypothetical protein